MNRDDVLRELELLPAWQLRAPPKVAEPLADKAPIAEVALESAAENTSLECFISDDKRWIFAYLGSRMDIGSQGILFKNILHAIKISKINKVALGNITDAKVIIAMGESVAQQLLNSTESIEQLRGKTHTYQHIPLIVTYDTQELLQNLANKAKTWDDLRMALNIVNA